MTEVSKIGPTLLGWIAPTSGASHVEPAPSGMIACGGYRVIPRDKCSAADRIGEDLPQHPDFHISISFCATLEAQATDRYLISLPLNQCANAGCEVANGHNLISRVGVCWVLHRSGHENILKSGMMTRNRKRSPPAARTYRLIR